MHEEIEELERKEEELKNLQSEKLVLLEKIKILEETVESGKEANNQMFKNPKSNLMNRGI